MNTLNIKKSLHLGQTVIGTWVFEFSSPGLPRLLASAGVDFVVYDMEHSGLGVETVRNLVALSKPLGLAAWVRPPAGEYHLIAPLLDVGATGIIVPKVETAAEAARIAGACRYFPEGHRGAAFSIAHDDFLPGDVASKMRAANEAMMCCALIETTRGVDNLEEILAVPGIDLVWLGYLDLSLSMGIPGRFTEPQFREAVERVLKLSAAKSVPAGILVSDPVQGLERLRQGFRCLGYSADLWLLQRALSEGVQAIRSELQDMARPVAAARCAPAAAQTAE